MASRQHRHGMDAGMSPVRKVSVDDLGTCTCGGAYGVMVCDVCVMAHDGAFARGIGWEGASCVGCADVLSGASAVRGVYQRRSCGCVGALSVMPAL